MSKRSRACDISPAVKKAVWERDEGRCIICGTATDTAPNSHYISRAQGGLGIEENVGTMCIRCHNAYDNGNHGERRWMKDAFRRYLQSRYPHWNETDLTYRR